VKCPECDSPLMIANSRLVSDEGSTEVYSEKTMVCINPKCNSYSGIDLNNPLKVVTVLRNKEN
jgi:hypothetical protein